jgi:hypothetical protein
MIEDAKQGDIGIPAGIAGGVVPTRVEGEPVALVNPERPGGRIIDDPFQTQAWMKRIGLQQAKLFSYCGRQADAATFVNGYEHGKTLLALSWVKRK